MQRENKSNLSVRIEQHVASTAQEQATATIDRAEGGHISEDTRKNEQTGNVVTPSTEVSRDEVVAQRKDQDVSEAGISWSCQISSEENFRRDASGQFHTALAKNARARLEGFRRPSLTSSKLDRSRTLSIGMTLRLIPAGEFMMGSPENDKDAALAEKPQHLVRISAFYLGVTEVTQAQYEAVTGSNPSHFSSTGDGKDKVAGRPTGQFPVERVSWLDAVKFCDTLSKMEDRSPVYAENRPRKLRTKESPGYRLPTEAEWEYACRAGTTTRYSFGDGPSVLGKYAWSFAHSGGMTHPVGEKLPNNFGLYDMYGNVREWCFDWFDGAYYQQTPVNDPRGPSTGSRRVIRGGKWGSVPPVLRSAGRSHGVADGRGNGLGFRVALGQPGH